MTLTGERSTYEPYHHDEPTHEGAMVAVTAGVVFSLIGILGFIPGATKHIDFKAGERFSGPQSHALLFDVFATSVLANLIFLLVGIVGAVASFFVVTTRLFFFAAFVLFGFFAVYGFSIDRSGSANFLPLNLAAAWLHAAIAVVCLITGLVLTLRPRR